MSFQTTPAFTTTDNSTKDRLAISMNNARRPAVSYVGHPIHFSSGQFAGQTIRTELIEVQQAELGRK